ncbi:MAG: hypothetical protein JST92_13800 [Deltaproteobacteria bacterium]|nr:hypothetical protein [Deltaproteobacteria bacterium]
MSQDDSVHKSLERLREVLAQPAGAAPPGPSPLEQAAQDRVTKLGQQGLALAAVLLTIAIASGQVWLGALAALLATVSTVMLIAPLRRTLQSSLPAGVLPPDPTRANIGMGAEVAPGAIIEPGATVGMGADIAAGAVIEAGATVEMGADVGAGSVIRAGAVVHMGATVGANVIIERDAVVSWGCDVENGAIVGERARVGAGATVGPGAQVPANTWVMPGADWMTKAAPPSPLADPRAARVEASCDRIESELSKASPLVRDALGTSRETVEGLRKTCRDLLEREQSLRAESSPESLRQLVEERATLHARASAETDEQIRTSLQRAIDAIDDQKKQRELLKRSADRLDAEFTRLMWTLDGLAAQLVRLRSAGQEASQAPDAEMNQSVARLKEEIEAIADALEQVGREGRKGAPIAGGPLGTDAQAQRERDKLAAIAEPPGASEGAAARPGQREKA